MRKLIAAINMTLDGFTEAHTCILLASCRTERKIWTHYVREFPPLMCLCKGYQLIKRLKIKIISFFYNMKPCQVLLLLFSYSSTLAQWQWSNPQPSGYS